MNTTRLSAILGTGLLACIIALPLFAQAGSRAPQRRDPLAFDAVVRPSEDLELAFSISGRVMEALAEPGDFVQAGSPLLRLDDRDARIRLKLAEIRARSTAALDAAKATLELQRDELETIKRARADDGVNEREVARQQLEVERAEATLLIEQLKREEAELEFEAAAVILEKYNPHRTGLRLRRIGHLQARRDRRGSHAGPATGRDRPAGDRRGHPRRSLHVAPRRKHGLGVAAAAGRDRLPRGIRQVTLSGRRGRDITAPRAYLPPEPGRSARGHTCPRSSR